MQFLTLNRHQLRRMYFLRSTVRQRKFGYLWRLNYMFYGTTLALGATPLWRLNYMFYGTTLALGATPLRLELY